VTLGDSVHLTARVLRQAGVEQIHAIIGGSIGGGQALEWLFQEEIPVRRLFDISGNNSRRGVAPEFFRLQAELLSGQPDVVPAIRHELRTHAADLLGKTPAFDRVFEHVDAKLATLASAYDRIEALRIARQIGFLRFVTPLFFQRRWDEDVRRLSDESLAVAGTVSWLEHQGVRFAQRFSPEALQALARMEAEAEPHNAAEVSARIRKTECHLVGFAVSGDVLFDAAEQFAFYRDVRDDLPADKQHLVDIQFAYDEVNGHDHFLSERFLENVPRLAKLLYDAPELDGFETRAIHKGHGYRDTTGAVIPPIYLTSTFESGNLGGFDYTRSGNPNFRNLEEVCASLENASYATVYGGGVAAITAVVSTLKSGDLVIAEEVIYGCTYRLFDQVFAKFGVQIEYYDLSDTRNFNIILEKKPALVWVESPTNPLLKIIDLYSLSKFTSRAGSTLLVDNTFASSYYQRPLDLGVDLSLASTTKYINGHSDCLGGVVCTNSREWADKLVFAQKALGLNPSPFDSWLINRGLKTLSLRMEKHQSNAMALARFLDGRPEVEMVRYPFLDSHPQVELARRQMDGGSGIVTAKLALPVEQVSIFLNALEQFALAESLGGIESLVCHPATMSHASVPHKERERIGISDSLVRFSAGVERAEDLIADVEQALERAAGHRQ
jgi:cystathionine gamma-synthase